MGVRTFYFEDLNIVSTNFGTMDEVSQPSAANFVATNASGTLDASSGAIDSDVTFHYGATTTWVAGATDGTSAPSSGTGNCFRSLLPYTGTFASGTWTVVFNLVGANNPGGTFHGFDVSIWKGPASGIGAVQLSSFDASNQVAYSATPTDVTITFTPGVEIPAGTHVLSGEYLFVCLSWNFHTDFASPWTFTSTLRRGTSRLVTPSFAATVVGEVGPETIVAGEAIRSLSVKPSTMVDGATAFDGQTQALGMAYVETAVPQESEAAGVAEPAAYVETPLPRESEAAGISPAVVLVEAPFAQESENPSTTASVAVSEGGALTDAEATLTAYGVGIAEGPIAAEAEVGGDQAPLAVADGAVAAEVDDVAIRTPETLAAAETALLGEVLGVGLTKFGAVSEGPLAGDAARAFQAGSSVYVEGPLALEGEDGVTQSTKLGRLDDNAIALDAYNTLGQREVATAGEGPIAADAYAIGPGVQNSTYREGALAQDSYDARPPVSLDSVFPTTWRTVRFALNPADVPDSAVSPATPGDALNPTSWFVDDLTPISVAQVNATTFDVTITERLPSHLTSVPVGMDGLVVRGVARHQTVLMPGLTWHEVFTPSGQIAQKRQLSIDLANPPTYRRNSAGIGGTLVVRGGDYATVTGTELVSKLILRRLSTPTGGFYHLPTYGLGLLSNKDLFHPNDLVRLRAEVERQVRLEPEVMAARAKVILDTRGILYLQVAAKTATGDVVEVNTALGVAR